MFLHNGKNAYICHPKKRGISSVGQSVPQGGKGAVRLSLFGSNFFGELAQLARALAWHARGRRFDSDILHKRRLSQDAFFVCVKALVHAKLPTLKLRLRGTQRKQRRKGSR
jgi:hypothetical protein